ncbi:MAG: type II secretion system protein GspD, partial [Methylococcales bacterium]|nr:type II secretion system protein GspD [Methylococcales bacterium]
MKPYKNHIKFLGVIALGSLSITACQPLSSKFHIGPKLGIKIPLEERSAEDYKKPTEDLAEDKDPVFSQLKNDNSDALEQNTGKNQTFIGNGQFVSRRSGSDSPKPKGSGKYSLNFDGADLGEVTKIILTDMLQKNYIMSPRVSGNVSLQTTDPLHKEELLPTLEMLLRINGAVLIKKDGIYRIETAIDGVQIAGASSMSGKNLKPGYQIKIIPLKYVGAADMAETIKPVLSKAILKIDPARNLLLAAGTKDELNKILELVRTFDVNFIEGMSFGLYPLENTEVESIVAEIDKVFNKGEKTPLSGMLKIISIKHLNSILVVTPQKAYLAEVEKWIKRFDIVNASGGEGGVTVYRVQHVDAVKLASTLTQVISGIASTKGKNASIAPGLKRATITNRNRRTNRGSTNKKSGTANASLEGVGIIADEVNNALVITARPQQYRTLHKIIKQLDVMPLQVLVDATIISVNLTDKLEYGVKWALTDA